MVDFARNGRKLKTASATATTAMQENASAELFRLLFQTGAPNNLNGKNALWSNTITTTVPGNRFASLKEMKQYEKYQIDRKAKQPQNLKIIEKVVKSVKKGSANYLRVMRGLMPMTAKSTFSNGITKYTPKNTTDPRAIIFNEFPEEYMKNDDWMETFQLQAEKLMVEKVAKKAIMSPDYTEFDRDAKNGFMEFIEKEIKKYDISKKDTWNPADIWLLKKTSERYVRTAIEALSNGDTETNIDLLNATMKRLMREHALIGISLKKISGDKASWKVYNLAKNIKFYGGRAPVYEASYTDSVDMPLTIKDFESGEDEKEPWKKRLYALGVKHKLLFGQAVMDSFPPAVAATMLYADKKGKKVCAKPQAWGRMDMTIIVKENKTNWAKLEIKSNSTSSASGQNLKFEPVELNAKAARMGKAEGVAVGKKFKNLGIQEGPYFNNWQAYPRSLSQWESERDTYKKLVKKLNTWKYWKQANKITPERFCQNVDYLFREVQILMDYDIKFDDIPVGKAGNRKGKKPLKPDHDEVLKRVAAMGRKLSEKHHEFKGVQELEIYAGETELKKVKGELVKKEKKEFVDFDGTGYKYALVKKVVPVAAQAELPEDEWAIAEIYESPNWGSDYTNAKFISNRLRFNITSKLMIIKVAEMLMRLDVDSKYKKIVGDKHTKFDVFCTEVIMLAQKAGPQFGPFGKLY